MDIPIKNIQIQTYAFPEDSNPFAFDALLKRPIDEIATELKVALEAIVGSHKVLIRGIQSGRHSEDRKILVRKIIKEGSDGYSEKQDGNGVLFAAPYEGLQTLEFILAGFHEFKPKCEERPQYPVDIWMIFDESAFKNIEYIHPRHNTKANDKWQIVDNTNNGLIGLVTIN
jgi:hypothetical protein